MLHTKLKVTIKLGIRTKEDSLDLSENAYNAQFIPERGASTATLESRYTTQPRQCLLSLASFLCLL